MKVPRALLRAVNGVHEALRTRHAKKIVDARTVLRNAIRAHEAHLRSEMKVWDATFLEAAERALMTENLTAID